ncbi:MAG TPA: hypothetical protein VHA70_02315 [Bauldia sp.]|nr:hypothetical protein [Bauldia sp.]
MSVRHSAVMNPSPAATERKPRRGELDGILSPHARVALRSICGELQDLHRRAEMIDDLYLATLIGHAADEALDQLRDDLVMREAAPPDDEAAPE